MEKKNPPSYTYATSLPANFRLSGEFKHCLLEIESGKNLYITGEAGTGKTTLLVHWMQKTKKNFVVLAPTGIAAINCGGQTIHSFFRFPHNFIYPESVRELPRAKQLFEKLDIVVIDECSMLRADLLDAIDYSLRLNGRDSNQPFGGIQVVLFGDLYQLPPVVDKELAEHYGEIYPTPYFFSADVCKEANFHYFCLKKNYRQRDKKFITLLNKIRNKTVTESDLQLLNSRVDSVLAESWEDCIQLTPTNVSANRTNQIRLARLPGDEFVYEALVKGEFDEASYPTVTRLGLKAGSQILMIKNDVDRRWVNGSVGIIVGLKPDAVQVRVGHGIHDVTPVIWEKIKYRHNDETSKIEAEVVGTFQQYPIKLAWAITIHKSQGLSFDRVIVDFDTTPFTHGQTYTALSRCRSLEDLVLKHHVNFSDIKFDERVHRISELFIPCEKDLPYEHE